MYKIKFGTDGWRAIVADDYTVENVARVAEATAKWVKAQSNSSLITLGYDCRFGGLLFSETVIKIMYKHGVKVIFDSTYCSTPMLSLATNANNAVAGVMITASHNPPNYNGFKLKSGFGGPTPPSEIQKVEDLIEDQVIIPSVDMSLIESDGMLVYQNFETLYMDRLKARFDIDAIRKSNIKVAYDAMFGAGQRVFPKLFPDALNVNCELNPSFKGIAPEPIPKNMQFFASEIVKNGSVQFAFATDGDADRIALMDSRGNYIDAHKIILMLIYISHKINGMSGKVVVAFSVSPKVEKMCRIFGLPIEVTKIGFKYIAEKMQQEDVLVGGEESGGIAVKGHIPERDGIWDAMIILDYLAKNNKTLEQLMHEVDEIVGGFAYGRNDLQLTEEKKQAILNYCQTATIDSLGGIAVEKIETIDGFKYHLEGERVLMIRASGTEPVLRVYCQAESDQMVAELLQKVCAQLLNV
jgi:phosphomannomutase